MWSFFSRDPAKDFPYEIGELVSGLEDKSIWTLHQGKKKSSGDPVSIFAFDVKSSSDSQIQEAKNSLKRIKTLRHPNILTFLDAVETDKVIYCATEPVIPLETHLRENASEGHNEIAISWGLHQIMKGLSFLVNDCNLIHNNVCMMSVFVDPAGEWKLAGVDYMYPAKGPDSVPPTKILPLLERYDPPEKVEGKKMRIEKWSSDMWGLGCLIWEVFNGTLPRTASLKSPGKIPQKLVPNYCQLVGANPRSRPNPAKFIEHCKEKGGFMCNSFVDSMLFLEEIQIKDQMEKIAFFSSLTPSLDTFPSQFCKNKILPQLLVAFEYGNAGSAVLAPMFKIGKLLDSAEYQSKIVPCVIKLFSSPDRATRVKLLQQIEFFAEHLQPTTVNDQIFPHVNSGFMDTNPMVRECTIKAMLHLAPKLNYKNLNEELMKQFARLQAKDDQGGIRTNTTICLGKISCHINPAIRQKILCSAFMRALKDPFPPARQAGILGIAASQNFYSLSDVAMRLLPALCATTRDPDKSVRDQAFKAINGFMAKLQKVSENPELEEEYEKDVKSGSAAPSTSGWAGWAVTGMSSLTSKLYNKSTAQKPAATSSQSSNADAKPSQTQAPSQSPRSSDISSKPARKPSREEEEEEEVKEEEEEAGDGWDEDDWGDLDTSVKDSAKFAAKEEDDDKENDGWNDDDDDDDWGSLEDDSSSKVKSFSQPKTVDVKESVKPKSNEFVSTKASGLQTTDTYNWNDDGGAGEDSFFSSLGGMERPRSKSNTPVRESPPRSSPARSSPARESASTKTKSRKQETGGWDGGAGWDEWNDLGDSGSGESQAEKLKREKAEKREQRQRELQDKREARKTGAMKLGAKKIVDLS